MTNTQKNTLDIQQDISGVGHKWVHVDVDDSMGGMRLEVETWIAETNPTRCMIYIASNGVAYRVW